MADKTYTINLDSSSSKFSTTSIISSNVMKLDEMKSQIDGLDSLMSRKHLDSMSWRHRRRSPQLHRWK